MTILLQANAQRKTIPFTEFIPSPDDDINYGLYAKIVRDGLPKTKEPKKVIIVGAGAAGLTAGYLLKQAGHEVRQPLKICFSVALDLHSKILDAPLSVQFSSFSCSCQQNLAK